MRSAQQIAIVLGGTAPHIELIRNLKERGYWTILVDYTSTPPAKEYADEHIQESTMDLDVVLRIATEQNADLVISTSVDQANVTACYVGERLGLPIPYSYATALLVTNKLLMKERMVEAGVDTSRHASLSEPDQIASAGLRFPLIVKPADSCASTAVRKANNQHEAERFFQQAKEASRTGAAIVEEFVSGRELSVYGFVKHGTVDMIMMSERHSVIDGPRSVLKCYSTTTPVYLSPVALYRIQVNADKIAKAFELENTPIHVQVLVDGDSVNVIEFAPRVGGGVSYMTIKAHTGFDIIDSAIDSFLGKTVLPDYRSGPDHYSINLVYAAPGIIGRITGFTELLDEGVVDAFLPYKLSGMTISDDRASACRVGAYIIHGKNEAEMLKKVQEAASRIDVLDPAGSSLVRRDLSLHQQWGKKDIEIPSTLSKPDR